MRLDPEAIRALVHRDRVHRSLYLDPEVFDLEMHKIFGGTWVYVGHESLVPKPGDFITTRIGKRPVVLSRHADGKIYVIHNSCGHRGAIVCNEEKATRSCSAAAITAGHSRPTATSTRWRCRAATARTSTSPIRRSAWAASPRRHLSRFRIRKPRRTNGPSLDEHLGHAKDSIDELCDRAPAGEIDLGGGVHKYLFRGNWKLQLENAVDMYHVPFSHESTVRRSGKQFGRRAGEDSASAISDRGSAAQRWEQRSAWGARSSGHSYNGHQPIAEQLPDDPVFNAYRAMLEQKHGATRTRQILTPKRHNTAFYPNMTLQALNQHVRVIVPVAVDRTEVHVYPVMLKGAPDEMNKRLCAPPQRDAFGGLADPDRRSRMLPALPGRDEGAGLGLGVVRARHRHRQGGRARRLRQHRHGRNPAAGAIHRLATADECGGLDAMLDKITAMTAPLGDLRTIEKFLFHEAQLLDERRFEEWRDLFAEDGAYWVPLEPDQVSPEGRASLFYDDKRMMDIRFERLRHPNIHSQSPPHRTCHVIGNIVVETIDEKSARVLGHIEHDYDRLSHAHSAAVFRPRAAPAAAGRRQLQDRAQARRFDQLR